MNPEVATQWLQFTLFLGGNILIGVIVLALLQVMLRFMNNGKN